MNEKNGRNVEHKRNQETVYKKSEQVNTPRLKMPTRYSNACKENNQNTLNKKT